MENKHFIIDFDSTFTKVEALDVLCEVVYGDNGEGEKVLQQIKDITDSGMAGTMSFTDSLKKRLDLIKPHKDHLPELVKRLKAQVSESFKRNQQFIQKYAPHIYILSNGFREFIVPIVEEYGIHSNQVFANEFIFDDTGSVIGFDENNTLARNLGKPEQIRQLGLKGEIFVLGDGYTDYEIKKAGIASKFYVFTENVRRESVLEHADHEAPNLDDFLYEHKLDRSHSYPKNRIKVLVLENIHQDAVDRMREEGFSVETVSSALSEEELMDIIPDVSIICIRSKTHLTRKVLEKAKRLLAIGAFCIGTNQIDLKTATERGIAVFNAPFSNTRSVVELAIAEIILLLRNLPDRIRKMHEGAWDKSAGGSYEMRGKTIGIVGYGNIGSQLSVLAESLGLQVVFYDLEEKLALGNARKAESLHELIQQSDIISLHVDGRPENEKMLGVEEFSLMKKGVILLNLSRGHVLDIHALKEAVEKDVVHGLAVDVFPEEPKSNSEPFKSELQRLRNTILTPHIGGSTQEAQRSIAEFVPSRLFAFVNTGSTANSVNLPNLTLPELQNAHRFIHIHENRPGIMAHMNQILADHSINVIGQYLKTNEDIGYVITDIDKDYPEDVVKELRKLEGSISFRVLY